MDKLAKDIFKTLECKHEITKEYIAAAIESIKRFEKKQDVYSTDNITDSGEQGLVTRIGDFLSQIKRYLSVDPKKRQELDLTEEKITKSFLDIGVFGIIAYVFRNGKWK